MDSDSQGVDTVHTREEYVHHAELAGALESFRGEDIDGKIVAAEHPSEQQGHIKLTWACVERATAQEDSHAE